MVNKIRRFAILFSVVGVSGLMSGVYAHLPSKYSPSVRMGRRIGTYINGKQTRQGFSNKGEWNPETAYNGDFTIPAGDTVSWGEFNGKKLWWFSKFYAKGKSVEPGIFSPEGGTSPWVLINSISAEANGASNYVWKGYNGDMEDMTGLDAQIPTWRDGAEGAYSFTHDDIGAMPFEKSVKPALDVAMDFPDIKQSWGIYLEKMKDDEWNHAIDMVLDGHEVFNHSMRHTSAADQWQWFYPGERIPAHDPAIPTEVMGLTVEGTWGDVSAIGTWPPPNEITIESDIVSIKCTPYWTGASPSSEPVGTEVELGTGNFVKVIEPVVTPKSGTETIILETGQKQYVKYTKKDETGAGKNEGKIAATGVTWFELEQLDKFGNSEWNSNTQHVKADKGVPGFVAKIYCVKKWEPADYKDNIQDANAIINEKVYDKVFNTGEYFKKGKQCEYYGYPFDAYSEQTHDSLEANGFVGARGGAKSGRPMPGDFFHPYRIDFDAFYIERSDWTVNSSSEDFVYPKNKHVLLGVNQMVDEIIKTKGYMVREFHAVADIADGAWFNDGPAEYWPINSAAEGVGGWWGGITANQLREHYTYLQSKINERKITVYTASEATKYRMTANACSGARITEVEPGQMWNLSVTTSEDIPEKYHDEITVMVSLPIAADSLGVKYKTIDPSWGERPRRRPRKMDAGGKIWSVSVNPYLGDAEIIWNGDWPVSINSFNANKKNLNHTKPSFLGAYNNIAFINVPSKGLVKAELYNLQGKIVNSISINANRGLVKIDLNSNVGNGMYLLKTKFNGKVFSKVQKITVK